MSFIWIFFMSFAWSFSRSEVFRSCQRKYFFTYYTKFLKNYFGADLYEKLLILKDLKSLSMWIGEIYHAFLSDFLNSLFAANLTSEGVDFMLQNFQVSAKKTFEQMKNLNYKTYSSDLKGALEEFFYLDSKNYDEFEKKFEEKLNFYVNSFLKFLKTDFYKQILDYYKKLPAGNIYVEKAKKGSLDFEKMKFYLEEIPGVIIYAQPDFGVKINDNYETYIIYDWKTGEKKNTGVSDQLRLYALKVLKNLEKVFLKQINLAEGSFEKNKIKFLGYEYYFAKNELVGGEISEGDILQILNRLKKEVFELSKFLVDGDFRKNIPVSFEDFSVNKSKCKFCRFRYICKILER